MPSFGEWGFVIASKQPYEPPTSYLEGLRFLSAETAPSLFRFPKDMREVDVETNHLNNQVLVQYYDSEWRHVTD